MTPIITYTDGDYLITDGDATLGYASTYHDAAAIEASYLEARYSAIMGGDALLIEAGRFAARGREAWRIGPICPTCGDDGDCPDCGTYTDCDLGGPGGADLYAAAFEDDDERQCDICDNQRVVRGPFFDIPCPYCSNMDAITRPDQPLLAQCAAVLDACLGGPVIGGGILDELRRVRAALANEGW